MALRAQKASILPRAVAIEEVRLFATIEISCLLRNSLGSTEAFKEVGFRTWFEMGHQIESCLAVELQVG